MKAEGEQISMLLCLLVIDEVVLRSTHSMMIASFTATIWADTLLASCGKGMHHDPNRIYGENAAGNSGTGKWAGLRTPDQILTRFVEYEEDDSWPRNSHFVQALWRGSNYVGCADSHVVMDAKKGKECHTQVCRYARTGEFDTT